MKKTKNKQTKSEPKEKINVSEVECEGVVVEALPNAFFNVELKNGNIILCSICGKIRKNNIRITLGDNVLVGVSIYDMTRGRILWRMK